MTTPKRTYASRTRMALILFTLIASGACGSSKGNYVFDLSVNADAGDAGVKLAAARSLQMGASGEDEDFRWDEDTVVDLKARLTWQRSAPSDRYAWRDAQSYCEALELS